MLLNIHQKSASVSGSVGLSQLTWRDSWLCQNQRSMRRENSVSKPCGSAERGHEAEGQPSARSADEQQRDGRETLFVAERRTVM